MPYLLHVAVLTAGIYLFYQLLLHSETFFRLNRWILLSGLVLAFAIPLIPVPQDWSFREAEVPLVLEEVKTNKQQSSPLMVMNESPMTHIPQSKINKVEDVLPIEQLIPSEKALPAPVTVSAKKSYWKKLSLQQWLSYLYLGGLIIFTINFLIQFFVLLSKSIRRADIKDGPFRIIELEKDEGPFSFWNTIFLNPSKYDPDTFRQILDHEKIHVAQRHSIDIFLSELLLIVQWFNPFAWLYRKAVENNLEFLTDLEMLKSGTDREHYQMSLLRVSVPHLPLHLTSNYNQSILKKRILMMNGKRSSLQSMWKYLMIFPLLGCSMLFMNAIIPHDMERAENFKEERTQITDNQSIKEQEIRAEQLAYKESIQTQSNEQEALLQSTPQPQPALVAEQELIQVSQQQSLQESSHWENGPAINSGNWKGKLSGDQLCILFSSESNEEGDHHWRTDRCFPKSAFSSLPTNGAGSFTLQREAGTLTLEGQFAGNKGEGEFSFKKNAAFENYLKGEGIQDLSSSAFFFMCLSDINKEYIAFLRQQNYDEITGNQLQALAIHEVSLPKLKDYLSSYKDMGYSKLQLDEVIALNIHEVDPTYAREMRSTVGEDLTIEQLIAAKIHNVEGDYIKEMQTAFGDMEFDELIGFAIHNVQPSYLKDLEAAGLKDLSNDEVLAAAIHNVDAGYIKEMKAAFGDMKFDELVGFAIHNVKPAYLQELKAAGLKDLSNDEIMAAAIHNVDAGYIKEMKAAFGDMKFDELVGFAIHNVKPAYLQELKAAGLKDLSNDEIMSAAIHNVDADYIKEMKAAFGDMKFDELVGFAIHNVKPAYLQELKAAGLKDLSNDEIMSAAIHNVDADYIKEMKAAFGDMKFDELVGFAIHNVKPAYLQELKAAGLKDLSNDEIMSAAIHNIDAAYIKKMKAAFGDMEFDELVGFAIHNVDPAEVKELRATGLKDLNNENIIALAIHNVDAKYINSFKAIGMNELTAEEVVMLKIHNVKPKFIQEMREKGHTGKSVEQYIELKLHNGRSYH